MLSPALSDPKLKAVYDRLKKVRESKTVELRPTPMLRDEIELFGEKVPFKLRYYQTQGVFHLLSMNRMVLGDGTGLGKTVSAIATLCYLWERNPSMKTIVVCPKSAIRQWVSEVDKFSTGINVFVAVGTVKARLKIYDEWFACKEPSVLLLNYHTLGRDWDQGAKREEVPKGSKRGKQGKLLPGVLDRMTGEIPSLTVTFDECTAFKNPSTKTHQTCKFLSKRSQRVWGLTATLLKNNLMEGFGIYQVIRPGTFTSKTRFMNDFCVTEMQRIRGGGRVPIVVGYKNLTLFRSTIDPFFYGRPKHVVSDELPTLTTREVLCELSKVEDDKYTEALSGLLELGDGNTRDYQDTKTLTSLIYTQEVCDSLHLLKFDGEAFDGGKSAKEEVLVDLLKEEFDGEKVIIYSRFEKMVTRLQDLLAKERIKSARITGKEKDTERKKSQDLFQDPTSDVKVIFITDAGSEAINLQQAAAMIFFDTPWSWGHYVQLLGRMIRIGSPHQKVYAIHLVSERPGRKGKARETLDHKVISTLRKKKGLIDQVLGEAAVGALRFERGDNEIRELVLELKRSA